MPPVFAIDDLRIVAHVSSGAPISADVMAGHESQRLTACALAYGMGAVVFLALERAQLLDTLDATSLATLRDELITTTGANLRRASQLSAILTTLDAAAITALAYKGPALSGQAYGHIGGRLFDDLDILVVPADRTAASPPCVNLARRPNAGTASANTCAIASDSSTKDGTPRAMKSSAGR